VGTGLVRFGVAMEAELLQRFDARVEAKGYATRSEALRDLVRADLVDAALSANRPAVATLTLVYDHHVRELTERLTEMQHALGASVVSTLHVHLDRDHCLEVIVLRGPSALLHTAANRLLATKGVKHGRLVASTLPGAEAPPDPDPRHTHTHDHAHTHTHDHGHAQTPHPKARRRPRRGPR
jgi:CopG family nickel-responsive transcriptional regulator